MGFCSYVVVFFGFSGNDEAAATVGRVGGQIM